MNALLWVSELAAAFWKEAGEVEPFPRELRRAISRALPLDVLYCPRLHLAGVRDWLDKNQISCPCDVSDRWLRACLVARFGHGMIFVDGADPEDEQRFSLAHELAHFLRDYWQPRRRACECLGETVLEVLDGKRPPTKEERIDALLAHVPIGFHIHLLERTGQCSSVDRAVAQAEQEADLLAYELLAPAADVCAASSARPEIERSSLVRCLQQVFGLPAAQADDYCRNLLPINRPAHPLLRQLGLIS